MDTSLENKYMNTDLINKVNIWSLLSIINVLHHDHTTCAQALNHRCLDVLCSYDD